MAEEPETSRLEKPFLEHLEDLRSTILRVAAWVAAGMLVAIPLAPAIIELLKRPLVQVGLDPETFLKVIHVAGGFSVAMRVVFWSGLLISLPGVLWALARFVYPGLLPKERRAANLALLVAGGLFMAGVCLGYFMTLPVAIKMMLRINEWIGIDYDFVELADYVSFILKLLIAFGLAFELPVVVMVLGALGIVSSMDLRTKRRHVVVGLMVLAMLLTPQDPITMLLMGGPLVALYECCIWLIWFKERRDSRRVGGTC